MALCLDHPIELAKHSEQKMAPALDEIMNRIYTDNGQGISTKLKSIVDGKKYIISTAKNPLGGWQHAVFRVLWEIPYIFGKADLHNPLRVDNSQTFESAERKHFEIEKLVVNSPQEVWRNWPIGGR